MPNFDDWVENTLAEITDPQVGDLLAVVRGGVTSSVDASRLGTAGVSLVTGDVTAAGGSTTHGDASPGCDPRGARLSRVDRRMNAGQTKEPI